MILKHQDCVLTAKKAIIGLINADQKFIKQFPFYSWEMANGAVHEAPQTTWGIPCEDLQHTFGLSSASQLLPAEVLGWTSQPE